MTQSSARRAKITLMVVTALGGTIMAPAGELLPDCQSAPNLFHTLLGKSESELSAKLDAAWRQLFYGDDKNQRVYYPVGGDMAYIADVGSNDVRTEGMSYGMMIAVQTNHQQEFNRLWRWADKYMRHPDGARRGFFAWHCNFDGTSLDPGSASDGEEWFAMALLFASHRWGDGRAHRAEATVSHPPGEPFRQAQGPEPVEGPRLGGDASPYHDMPAIDYGAEAQALLREMLHKKTTAEVTPLFNLKEKQVTFAPTPGASRFTDPSYHLPTFYELWARWAEDPADRQFWAEAAKTSRKFFRATAHPATGLMPEFAHFDGRPYPGPEFGGDRGDFRFDAWRTLANVAIDHAWWQADPWQVEQSNRVLGFLGKFASDIPNQFSLAGKPLSTDVSTGLLSMAAVAGLAADPAVAQPFVQRLWDTPIPDGQWRYYDGLLYFLGLLEAGGRFQAFAPVQK
jgi:oligosaccharide reducing-end xylanase